MFGTARTECQRLHTLVAARSSAGQQCTGSEDSDNKPPVIRIVLETGPPLLSGHTERFEEIWLQVSFGEAGRSKPLFVFEHVCLRFGLLLFGGLVFTLLSACVSGIRCN